MITTAQINGDQHQGWRFRAPLEGEKVIVVSVSPEGDVTHRSELATDHPGAKASPAPKHLATVDGFRRAAARLAVCGACPHLKGSGVVTVRCSQCGCGGKSLTQADASCPLGKWPAEA